MCRYVCKSYISRHDNTVNNDCDNSTKVTMTISTALQSYHGTNLSDVLTNICSDLSKRGSWQDKHWQTSNCSVPERRGVCRPHSKPWGWSPESCWCRCSQTQPASAAWLHPGSVAPPPGRSSPDAPATRGTCGPPAGSSRTCSPRPHTSLPLGEDSRLNRFKNMFWAISGLIMRGRLPC